ncbi:MAG: HIT domain-containing protein [Candidatus Omnitrophica bacterium]|nr:HIT domain-containing protein [Candidatus Omnitrophota bacterium]
MRDILWAPWRIKYIKSAKRQKGCFFCQALKSKGKNYIIFRNKYSFAILNIFPYNNGHIMVSPKRHIKDLRQLKKHEVTDLFDSLKETLASLDRVLKPEGYNIGINSGRAGGAGVLSHLHIHIVPRWSGDTNFMPLISGTKVIAQSLDELYRDLSSKHVKPKRG